MNACAARELFEETVGLAELKELQARFEQRLTASPEHRVRWPLCFDFRTYLLPLAAIPDPRVKYVRVENNSGVAHARNVGIGAASGRLIAMLDDDDEWLPEKLAAQVELGSTSGLSLPIVSCQLRMVTPRAELVMPRRLPQPGEPPSEYLAVRHGLFHGDGFLQTSTIMARTELLRKVPFTEGLRRLQELDWSLRCLELDGTGLCYVPRPLVTWYADENRSRISFDAPWRQSLEWLDDTRSRVTPRAYAALAMSVVSSMAATSNSPRVFFHLLGEARRHGQPGLLDYVTFLQVWLVPPGLRRLVRDRVLGRRQAGAPATSSNTTGS